jgi:S-adenosylmethionine-diacylgycerolhomoserine-N-methlytransferase
LSAYAFEIDQHAVPSGKTMFRMNRVYRWQRRVYDAAWRCYLLARDRMIAELKPAAGANVLEIGCGIGRNLVLAACRYPCVQFFGIDVSKETSARAAISRAGLHGRIAVAHGDATAATPRLSALARFDHVMIFYALAMIPDWRRVLETAVTMLCPGGRLHVVGFGNFDRLPGIASMRLSQWLSSFEVSPRDEPERKRAAIAASSAADLTFDSPFRGYANYAVLTAGAGPGKP